MSIKRWRYSFQGAAAIFFGGLFFALPLSGLAEQNPGSLDLKVRISVPTDKQPINGICTVRIDVPSSQEIAQVMLSRDGAFLESNSSAPFEIQWDTRSEADGPHLLVVRAQTKDGKWHTGDPVSVIIDNTPPVVRLKPQSPNGIVTGKISLEAEAHDNIAIAEVRFFVDNLMLGTASAAPYAIAWNPSGISNGRHLLKAVAFDEAGNSASNSMEIRVSNPNRAPILTPLEPKTVLEGKELSFTVFAYDPDGPRDPVTYRATGLPPWATFNPQTGEFIGTPDFTVASQDNPKKEYTVTFEACDPEPLCASQQITITVMDVNQPPVLKPIENQKIHEGEPLRLTLNPAVDPDGDPVTYQVRNLPLWLQFNAETLTFSGTPGYEIASLSEPEIVYPPIKVEACDPKPSCSSAEFTVTVLNTNRPPVFDPIEPKEISEGAFLSFEVRASDPDRDRLTLAAQPLPEGARFTDHGNGTGTFEWATRIDQGGRFSLVFTASDGQMKEEHSVPVTLREEHLAISGTVKDKNKKPVANVTIDIETAGKVERQAITDNRGFYLVPDLPPGTYTVRPNYQATFEFSSTAKTAPGLHFSPLSQNVTLTNSDQREIDFNAMPLNQ